MLSLDVVLATLLVTACYVVWLAYKEHQRSDSMLSQARAEIGRLEDDLSRRQQQFEEMAEKFDEMSTVAGAEIQQREKLKAEHELRVFELNDQFRRANGVAQSLQKDVNDIKATLQKRDAELTNMRNDRIRADATIEGLAKQLRQEHDSSKGLRHRLAEAEKSIAGQRRENQSAIHHHAEAARQRDQLAAELDAAKTLLAGVKIGVGELLIVQPEGECTEQALEALRSQMGAMDGKVVVVDHVNAWRATPIPKPLDVTKPIEAMFATPAGKEME